MKKLYPVIFAVVIGCSCAFFLFSKVERRTLNEKNGNAVGIQIGVFKTFENADAMRKTYGGIVLEDEDLYRVYYSILNQDDNIEFITNYLTSKGINYYLKSLTLENSVIDKSVEYETLMSKTNEESKLSINEKLLSMYKEVV